jgi:hypothetical protein
MRGEGPRLAAGGAAAAAVVFVLAALAGGAGWRAWLAAAVLCAGVPTGAVTLSAMTRLIPGAWRAIDPPLEAMRGGLPLAALAMAPVLLVPGQVFGWVGAPGAGAFRGAYLNPLFFALRGAAWFALLAAVSVGLGRRRATRDAVLGLLLITPASLLIATDWLMSLDQGFASSGFGLYVLAIQVNLALSLAVAAAAEGSPEPARDVLGGVLLTGLALWAYLGFMPYFIIWSNDLPESLSWYLRRGGPWAALAGLAMVLKLGAGAALLAGHVRRDARALRLCALAAAGGAVPEIAWIALPAPQPPAGPIDLALFAGASVALGVAAYGLFQMARARREASP